MTKNVELHLHKWSKMKGALGSVTETGSGGGFSGGSYSSWGGPAMSSYSGIGGSGSQGFANRIKSLVEITEKAKRAINELDVDGAIGNLHFHDDHVTAISLQSKLTALETYAGKVQEYLKDKIDQPFYEKLDKVGDRLSDLNIASYKVPNAIGYKTVVPVTDEVGRVTGTREVLAKEVGLKELYQVDNPYKKRLQAMYDSYKSSDDYKESKLSEEDYLFASHQTRAFTYHSLNDEKAAFEGKRDLLLAAGVVILSIFCPPAGAVAGVALAAADMYSAASGKDWMTGRDLDDSERLMRGAFALFDLVPGVGYLNDLAKTGKVAGLAGIKASLKTSFKEGMEQAAKNVDNFKVVLKNVDDFGKKVITKIDDFGKQLDNLANRTVISGAEELSAALRTADSVISEAAQNFRLNIENIRNAFVPQFAYETVGVADDVVKNADEVSQLNRAANKIDEFVEARRTQLDDLSQNRDSRVFLDDEGVPRIDELEVSFNYKEKFDRIEFERQLMKQQDGLNDLTIQEFLDNRENYLKNGRSKEGTALQKEIRQQELSKKYREILKDDPDLSKNEAMKKAEEFMKGKSVLHDPDQVAGGNPMKTGGLGDSRINSSIGSQWRSRIDGLHAQIEQIASELTVEQLQNIKLNIKLILP